MNKQHLRPRGISVSLTNKKYKSINKPSIRKTLR